MEIITREITSTNWITIVIVSCFGLLAIAKTLNTVQFSDFIMLFNNNKYIVLNHKGNRLSTLFNGVLLLVQTLSISLFIYICVTSFQFQTESKEQLLFLKISTLYLIILVCKILIEKIVASIFSIETLIEDYLFYKISYRNFLGVLLLPLNLLFIYTIQPSEITLMILLSLMAVLNSIVLFSVYKKNEKVILNQLFYFILYLCTLEIAPYFILYKLII